MASCACMQAGEGVGLYAWNVSGPVLLLAAQFFERPSQLPGSEQQDDLLFFVVHEAYQVTTSASGTQHCRFHHHASQSPNPPAVRASVQQLPSGESCRGAPPQCACFRSSQSGLGREGA